MTFGQEAKHARVSAGLSVDVHQGPFVVGLKETFFVDLFPVREGSCCGSPQIPFILPCAGQSIVSRVCGKSRCVSLEGQWLLGQGAPVP